MVTKEKGSLWIDMWAPTHPESYIFYEIKNKDMQGETRVSLYGGNNWVYDNGLRKMLFFPKYEMCTHMCEHTHTVYMKEFP